MARLAIFLDPGKSLSEAVGRVRLAESLGYDSVWVTQIASREPFQVLSHYGHHTERIGLGTGVVPIMLRHPVLTAVEAITLDETSGGRLRLGLGVSHRITVEGWYGLTLDDPIGRMREYATIVRGVFRDGQIAHEGVHYTARFRFAGRPKPDLPILFAALSPKMLRLAAEAADGVVLWMCSPAYIRETVVPTIEEELSRHGRTLGGFEIVAAVPLGLTENPDGARDAVRRRAFPYLQLPFYRRAIAAGGYQEVIDAVDQAVQSGDREAALRAIPDAFVDDMAGVGDARAIQSKLADYVDAGVTLPAVGPITRHPGGGSVDETLQAIAPTGPSA
ncbi:MAG: LLM class flavin-dependent oxidoreductase [Actinomycetota bacterium]